MLFLLLCNYLELHIDDILWMIQGVVTYITYVSKIAIYCIYTACTKYEFLRIFILQKNIYVKDEILIVTKEKNILLDS